MEEKVGISLAMKEDTQFLKVYLYFELSVDLIYQTN